MLFELKNSYIILLVQKPGSLYKGARFDYTGQIIQVTYLNKHTFCSTEKAGGFKINEYGRGLYNEFGIEQAVGYNDCPVTGKFPKIGVGDLTRKSADVYNFFENYDVEPYIFTCSVKKDSAHFTCETEKNRDYSFRLDKTVILDKNTFTIQYNLQNFGKKVIRTNEYVHNFLSINNKPIDQTYKLSFSIPAAVENFHEAVNPDNVVKRKKDIITWNGNPREEFFLTNSNPGKTNGKWLLTNSADKVGIEESCSFEVEKINLWGAGHVVSPEFFCTVYIEPGQNLTWSRKYSVFNLY